ncbi:MAG: hypothetical protein ACYCOR_20805 [Acidobacteriaceae bacterium]
MKDALCSAQSSSASSAQSLGVKFGIPIPVISDLLNITFNGSNGNYSSWQSGFCQSRYEDHAAELHNLHISKVFSDNARKAVDTCLSADRPVYGLFTIPRDGSSFGFVLKVSGKDRIKHAEISPASAVKGCRVSNPFNMNVAEQYVTGMDITGPQKAFNCGWNSNQSVWVDIALSNQGDHQFLLPAVEKRPNPPKELAWHDRNQAGVLYEGQYAFDPMCRQPSSNVKPNRCNFVVTGNYCSGNTACNSWIIEHETPGQVYDVTCQPLGNHEWLRTSNHEGNIARCMGEFNGGDQEILMTVKWKQLW